MGLARVAGTDGKKRCYARQNLPLFRKKPRSSYPAIPLIAGNKTNQTCEATS